MIFAIASFVFFSTLIAVFFKSHQMCGKCGLHCIFKNVLCCPCPDPCLNVKPYPIHTKSPLNIMRLNNMNVTLAPNRNIETEAAPQNEIYLYHGSKRIFLLRQPQQQLTQPARNDEATQVKHLHMHVLYLCPFKLQHGKAISKLASVDFVFSSNPHHCCLRQTMLSIRTM